MDFGGQGLCFHVGMWCCLHIKFSILNSTSIMESIVLRSQGLLRSGPCHTMLGFCLTWSWTGNHSCCEFMSVIVCHVQKTASHSLPASSDPYIFPISFTEMFLSLGVCGVVVAVGGNVPLRVEHSVFYSQLWVSTLTTAYCKKLLRTAQVYE